METYYLRPEPEKIVCSLLYYADSPGFENQDSRMPAAYFYAALLEGDPKLSAELLETLARDGSPNARALGLHVLWVLDSDESRAAISRAVETWNDPDLQAMANRILAAPRPGALLDRPVTSPVVLDELWSTFSATGAEAPVRRVISVLHLEKDGHGMDIALGGAAQWSTASMARRHPRIREILARAAKEESDPTKSMIEEILEKASAPAAHAPPTP